MLRSIYADPDGLRRQDIADLLKRDDAALEALDALGRADIYPPPIDVTLRLVPPGLVNKLAGMTAYGYIARAGVNRSVAEHDRIVILWLLSPRSDAHLELFFSSCSPTRRREIEATETLVKVGRDFSVRSARRDRPRMVRRRRGVDTLIAEAIELLFGGEADRRRGGLPSQGVSRTARIPGVADGLSRR